jgi:hypothetical protein
VVMESPRRGVGRHAARTGRYCSSPTSMGSAPANLLCSGGLK